MPIQTDYAKSIGSILAKQARNAFRVGFETSFHQIQNTTITRINSEIDKIDQKYDLTQRNETLLRELEKIENNRTLIAKFHEDNLSNTLRLTDMEETAADAISAFSTDDANTNLTASELETVTALQKELADQTERLILTVHPDFVQPYILRDVKNDLEELRSYTAVEGVVDGSGSGSPSNDNRNLLDFITTFSAKLTTANLVSEGTRSSASQVLLTLRAKVASVTADQVEVSAVELQKRDAEIEDVKAHYANILKVISISFEARANQLDQLGQSLEGGKVPPGSIMNLFT